MHATIKRNARGKWNVMVGEKLIRSMDTEKEAQDLVRVLARPDMFLDESDGYDFSYSDEPDGSSANPLPAKKLPGTSQD